MPRISIGEIELFFESTGAGEPLLLIPGFSAGAWIWFKQVNELSQKFRVITFDPRGIANSDKPEGPQSIRLLAADVSRLLKALQIESAHIIGASFGGFVAQEFVLNFPQMTRKLVLCCTSFGGPNHVLPAPETLMALASTKGLNSEERMRENLLLAFTPEYVQEHPEEIEKIVHLRAANEVPEYVYLSQLQAAMGFNAERRLSEIRKPTLVLSGDADIIVPVQNSRNLANGIPDAELRIIGGGSHMFFMERAAEFNGLLTEFLGN